MPRQFPHASVTLEPGARVGKAGEDGTLLDEPPYGRAEEDGERKRLDKAWTARKEVFAVRQLKLPNTTVIARTPQQLEIYVAYKWMASATNTRRFTKT